MITSVETYLVDSSFIEKKISKAEFKKNCYTKHEIEYCDSKASSIQNYSARYAAKMAFFKAVDQKNIKFKEIEVLNDVLGKPYFEFYGSLKKKYSKFKFHLSISHLKNNSIAFVVMEV